MSRWAPDARERLREAAIELFAEQGFAATTVPQIVERAGLTTRTFFRHFQDKREVFFGNAQIPDLAERMLADAPPGGDPLALIMDALRAVARERFDPRRDQVVMARRVIESDSGLRERDLQKREALARAIRSGFLQRGEPPMVAMSIAAVAVDILHIALETWGDDPDRRPMEPHLDAALGGMRAVFAH
ncbi:TetR/AcrR family transcriptional regulator [Naasia lichenicola]|uniref:TetR family transcriptional regulator n=1 Tax=Naasia lichenicola TaxID=2565933 RepID=A0A4S4FGL6_9MICO|nr:TetR/AcrR family transcriptional regulator [Naasia lichenicola]THG29251.1 TetR family transcriptional regulator [Naasia lichenicola]